MKVTREEGFTPITIVLETKEEALLFWNKLNNCDFTERYTPYGEFGRADLLATGSKMLGEINKVFHP